MQNAINLSIQHKTRKLPVVIILLIGIVVYLMTSDVSDIMMVSMGSLACVLAIWCGYSFQAIKKYRKLLNKSKVSAIKND